MGKSPGSEAKLLVLLTFQFHQEEGKWIGICKELGTSTFGKSLNAVKSELLELVDLHLNTLEDVGERKRFFAEKSIKTYSLSRIPKKARIDVPISRSGGDRVFTESVARPVALAH